MGMKVRWRDGARNNWDREFKLRGILGIVIVKVGIEYEREGMIRSGDIQGYGHNCFDECINN